MKKILAAGRALLQGARRLAARITPDIRQAIQGLIVPITTVLVALGLHSQAEADAWVVIATVTLQAGTGLLALLTLSPSQVATWFQATGRGIIYGQAVLVAPALQVVGWATEDQLGAALQMLSLALSTLANVLAAINKPIVVDGAEQHATEQADQVRAELLAAADGREPITE